MANRQGIVLTAAGENRRSKPTVLIEELALLITIYSNVRIQSYLNAHLELLYDWYMVPYLPPPRPTAFSFPRRSSCRHPPPHQGCREQGLSRQFPSRVSQQRQDRQFGIGH